MADQSAGLSYAEMIRRQSDQDLARWQAAKARRLRLVGRVLNQGDDGSILLELLTDADRRAEVLPGPSPDDRV